MTPQDRRQIAQRLVAAANSRTATTPVSDDVAGLTPEVAYDIQADVVAARVAEGHPIIGAKLGLTSAAKQRQMKVSEPLYGWLTSDMRIDHGQPLICGDFIQPRCEPEIAFRLGRDLVGPGVGASDVLAATELVFPAIDVLDSRFTGYSFTLPDVIADNSSSAAFVTGGSGVDPRGIDLRLVGVVLEHNGRLVATASGAAVLGHPAASIAWMVRKLSTRGERLVAGMTILCGALTEAVAVAPGDSIVVSIDRIGSVELPCR